VMIGNGGAVKPGARLDVASIYDVAPTLLYLLGEALPEDMDGRVLKEIITNEYLSRNPIRFTSGNKDEQTAEMEFSPDENADVIERLKSLGYIG